jgi:predicted metal-dependent enzyme (double-stranded beta helix superfamily)
MMAYWLHPPLIATDGRPWSLRRLLEQAEVTEGSEFRALVANDHHALDDSYSLQVFVWPPGSRTRIHEHSSWGAYCCAIGSVLAERYERFGSAGVAEGSSGSIAACTVIDPRAR